MSTTTFFNSLTKCKWNLKDIEELLSTDSSFINEKIFYGDYTPLHFVLQNKNCSLDVVKLLLKYGSDVNQEDSLGLTPLYIALEHSRADDIVIALITEGAHVKVFEAIPLQSPLCIALNLSASKDVIKTLLDMGYLMHACSLHNGSTLHCATDCPRLGVKLDVLQFLIERGADLNAVNDRNESVMCFALQAGNEAGTIKLLLDAGCSLNTCLFHRSSLICATYCTTRMPLRESTVAMLLKAGACAYEVNHLDYIPLQSALLFCRYELKAIALLLKQFEGVDMEGYQLLHLAVRNGSCLRSVIKLLIEKNIAKIDEGKNSVLNQAVESDCRPHIAIQLLKNNAKVDYKTVTLALKTWKENPEIFKVLLAAGASISRSSLRSLVIKTIGKYKKDLYRMQYYKLFLQYYFLKSSYYRIPSCKYDKDDYTCLLNFKEKCKQELLKMPFKYIGHGHTLYEFLSGSHSPYENSANQNTKKGTKEEIKYDWDLLLGAITNNAFPLYFDIISYKIGRSALEKILDKVPIYTIQFAPDNTLKESIVCYDCVLTIIQYLTVTDILSLILACFDGVPCVSSKNIKKRYLKIPDLRRKFPRQCKT